MLEASYFRGADSLPNGISATIKRGDTQLAVWRFKGRYYATQQMCPHKRAFILSDSLLGEDPPSSTPEGGKESSGKPSPWISCPHHKRNFDLSSGACKNDTDLSIATFDVEERPDGMVYLKLPPVEELDAALGTKKWMVKKGEAGPGQFAEVDKKLGFVGQRAKRVGVKPVGLNGSVKVNGNGNGITNGNGNGVLGKRGVDLMAGGGCGGAPEW